MSWAEPVFRDNVGIHTVMASFLPGHFFPEGRHHVLYQVLSDVSDRSRLICRQQTRRETGRGVGSR